MPDEDDKEVLSSVFNEPCHSVFDIISQHSKQSSDSLLLLQALQEKVEVLNLYLIGLHKQVVLTRAEDDLKPEDSINRLLERLLSIN